MSKSTKFGKKTQGILGLKIVLMGNGLIKVSLFGHTN
jgi:hypothetical protein